jgi:hypothetical protein
VKELAEFVLETFAIFGTGVDDWAVVEDVVRELQKRIGHLESLVSNQIS